MNSDISKTKCFIWNTGLPFYFSRERTKQTFFVLLNMILTVMVAINLEDRMESFQIQICLHTF